MHVMISLSTTHSFIHSFVLQKLQPWHIDANPTDVKTIDGHTITGYGEGFSAFLGLSSENTIWVAELSPTENKIINPVKLTFAAGDCVFLKYGTVHRGDLNSTRIPTYKVFTDVNSGKSPDSTSQLWVVEGEGGGLSRLKPKQ
jgi:hypothetical protein